MGEMKGIATHRQWTSLLLPFGPSVEEEGVDFRMF
jgi:hypothetical protein